MVSFWPARPLIQGQRYTVHLASGVRGENGRKLGKAQSWQVEVRQAEAIFLSPRQAPEIWRVSSDGKSRTQLTRTGGNVYNYTVSTDGNLLAYSVKNEQQGYDLWEMSRQGDDAHLLLPCGTDWCISPAYSPDGAWIAYSRRKNSGLPGRQPDAPQIWLLERTTQATDTLVADPNVRGTEPAWSPDGRYLAFSDQLAGGVRVQNMQAQTGFLLPAEEGTGIEWSPDSLHILYTQVEVTGELPYNSVYEADVQTQQTRRLLGEAADPTDYSVPAWAPDGVWATVGWRLAGGSWSKQLWLVRLGGSQGEGQATGERQAITMEENYTHTSYQWDPGGSFLLFQRLETGGTGSPPQVAVWSRGDRRMLPLAEDAFQPQWTP
jgi:TolB protein